MSQTLTRGTLFIHDLIRLCSVVAVFPHRLQCLNTWSQVVVLYGRFGTFRRRTALLEEVCRCGCVFEFSLISLSLSLSPSLPPSPFECE